MHSPHPTNTGEWLRRHGIRPSVQRVAVMDYLFAHRTHPTVEEIYRALATQIPTLSKTTVYNTLKLLVAQGAVAQIAVDPCGMRFDGDLRVHGHFFCSACGRLYDLFFDSLSELPMPEEGHAVSGVQLCYKGICAECRKRAEGERCEREKDRSNPIKKQ